MKLDQKSLEIQASISWNNSARLLAANRSNPNPDEVEALARELYARQIKLLEEINQSK